MLENADMQALLKGLRNKINLLQKKSWRWLSAIAIDLSSVFDVTAYITSMLKQPA